jgi:hypothetical protein
LSLRYPAHDCFDGPFRGLRLIVSEISTFMR